MDSIAPSLDSRIDDAIARLTIDNPARRNAMSLAMWQELGDVLGALAEDPDVRVLVLRGAGEKSFCAGNDISEFATLRHTPEQRQAYDRVTARAYAALEGFPRPTIARVTGFCIGGGLELAQLCDLQIAADTALFAVTPAKLGIGYKLDDVMLLTRNVAAKHAKELLFTGRRFPAEDALRWGLINRIVPEAELDAVVDDYAREIAANAPLSVAAAKVTVGEAVKEAAARDLELCDRMVRDCDTSQDRLEGQAAFAEKRPPDFQGR